MAVWRDALSGGASDDIYRSVQQVRLERGAARDVQISVGPSLWVSLRACALIPTMVKES